MPSVVASEAKQSSGMWIASAVNSYPAKAGEFSHGTYRPFAAQMGLGARCFAPRNDKGVAAPCLQYTSV
jgi:hypothetical protein